MKSANHVTLYANSRAVNLSAQTMISWGNAPFYAANAAQAGIINSLPKTHMWFYYPDTLGAALAGYGISSTIHAHSGIVYINGKPEQ